MKTFADILILFNSVMPDKSRNQTVWSAEEVQASGGKAFLNFSSAEFGRKLLTKQKQEPWQYWLLGETTEKIFNLKNVEKLNGHYCLIGFNSDSNEWHVWTNRLGTYHIYYAFDGKRAGIGTFYNSVAEAASAKQLDWEGLTGFFAFGFFPQDKTWFQDVKILRPASHYIFDSQGHLKTTERYWNWNYAPNLERSYDETVEQFGRIFEEVIKDQTREGRIAIPISGGLDSRTVAAAVQQVTSHKSQVASLERFWAYSYGYADYSPEIKIGKQIAQAAGFAFDSFVIPPYLFERMDSILNSVEGFQGVVSTRQAAISDSVAEHADYLMAGHWGDVWMDDMGYVRKKGESQDSQVLEHTIKKIYKNGADWLLENLCKDKVEGSPKELAEKMVWNELSDLRYIHDPDFRIKAFKTDQWSFRWTLASIRMFQPGAFPRLPFYDNRIVDFFLTVPSKFVKGRRLQIDYLKKFHPDIAKITWEVTDENLFASRKNNVFKLVNRGLKKIGRVLKNQPHIGRNWEGQFLNEKGKKGLREHLLKQGLRVHELIAPSVIEKLILEVERSPSAGNGYALSQLLTFSAWLERNIL